MTTVLLVRHGRTASNVAGTLAGWTPSIGLDDAGHEQARALARRIAPLTVAAVVASPLQRCQETAAPLLDGRTGLRLETDDRLGEVHYGDWTGRPLKELAKDPLWRVVQAHPSAMVFPGEAGEAMRAMAERAVAAVRDWNARLGPDAVWVAVSHGDVIKAVVADALGLHLDGFQRIVVDPCSVTVVTYTPTRPFLVRQNDTGGDLSALAPPKRRRSSRKAVESGDAVVGGGAG